VSRGVSDDDMVSGGITSTPFDEARLQARIHNQIFCYELSKNPRYKDACRALRYDPDASMVPSLSASRHPSTASRVLGRIMDSAERCIATASIGIMDKAEATMRGTLGLKSDVPEQDAESPTPANVRECIHQGSYDELVSI